MPRSAGPIFAEAAAVPTGAAAAPVATETADDDAFIRAARALLRELRRPRPAIYWADLLLTAAVLWSSLAVATLTRGAVHWTALAGIAATLALSRGAILLHELTHLRGGAVPGFAIGWNLLIGVPFLIPSFLYERLHRDHHRRHVYRTAADPEHPPDDAALLVRVARTLGMMPLLPAVLLLRWLVLIPAAALHPRLRLWVDAHASSLCGNLGYRPAPLAGPARRAAHAAEAFAFTWAGTLVVLAASHPLVARGALLGAVVLATAGSVAALRGELLHRFTPRPPQVSLARQVRDSLNVPHTGLASALLLPAGIGYHALHHLDVSLPYHCMGVAHRRLLAMLPAGSPYHAATVSGIGAAIGLALATARAASTGSAPPDFNKRGSSGEF